MTKKDIEKLEEVISAERIRHEKIGEIGTAEAWDIAEVILIDTPGLEDEIKKHYGVDDPQGWLADKINIKGMNKVELEDLLKVLNNCAFELYEFRADNGIGPCTYPIIEDVEIAIANAHKKLNSHKAITYGIFRN